MLPILRSSRGFPLGVSQFCKNLSINYQFSIIFVVPIFCGKGHLLGGQFWAMGKFNLLGGQSNLGGQMPTQFTYYLPPWFCTWDKNVMGFVVLRTLT